MLSRWVAKPCEGISNQLRSAGAALQRERSLDDNLVIDHTRQERKMANDRYRTR